ncbi:hypothetical protein GMRT_15315 [Giardia muris]|uniref:Uncharacterized protein n=1 Tax=Giardia muris TaxID=5742 RepID=A0A4Z1SVF1_GIAMU|nr:hypothetical protein GMRT_15315 [Giardia muris]|eukprot:TNJ28895.1 hypothetical protein GMRT_15315 [Giardia muris]
MDSAELSLERIQEYLADLGYQGVPEETLIQLKGELLRRMTAGAAPPALATDSSDEPRRRRKHRHEEREETLHPQPLTHDHGYVSIHAPDDSPPSHYSTQASQPRPRQSVHYEGYDEPDEEVEQLYSRRPYSSDEHTRGRRPRPTGSARSAADYKMTGRSAQWSGRDYSANLSGSSSPARRYTSQAEDLTLIGPGASKTTLFNSGTSKYTLQQKKCRKSDPVTNWARYNSMWSIQGGLDDARKRETRSKYTGRQSSAKSGVYRAAYD